MMRYLYIILALALVSCTESTLHEEEQSDYVDVSFSTYASNVFINDMDSRSVTEVAYTEYDVRYVVEAWSRGDNPQLYYRGVETVDNLSSVLIHSFRIIEGEYDFLFWADYVDRGKTADKHYNTGNGLMSVKIIDYDYTAGDSSRDCFAARREGVTVSSSVDMGNIELSRPMAMLVVKDSDGSAVEDGTSVSITFTKSIPNGYNVLSGEVITDENIAIEPNYPTTIEDDEVLAYDYIFIDEATTYSIEMTVGDTTKSSSATPFEPNVTTNIISTFFETTTN